MAGNADAAVADLLATARSARCHNAFFRQQQLKFLHDLLRSNAAQIVAAIEQDSPVTNAEATTEVAVVLNIVKEHHAAIDPKKELEEEYRVAKGRDALDRTTPWGVVYVEPSLVHTPLFSVVSPLAAALAAGNCVVMKLESTPRSLPSLLRNLLPQTLESDTFRIVISSPSSEALSNCLSTVQETTVVQPTYSQLAASDGRVLAVVDRSADLASAARDLVAARFAFGGTSPYAPDIILVNEFAKREFLRHVLGYCIPFLAASPATPVAEGSTPSASARAKAGRIAGALQALTDAPQWSLSIVAKGDNGVVVECASTRATHVPLPPKVKAPILCVAAVSSLDHAIDMLASDSDAPLTAAYYFAAPAHAKYLAQFIHANISFINSIPSALLLGPVGPAHHAVDVARRYAKRHFVQGRPVAVTAAAVTAPWQVMVGGESTRAAERLLDEATREIREKKRAEWIAIGFFEQGILIGLGVFGVPLLTCLGASLFFGVRAGMRKWVML